MKITVKEVATLTGISVRTLHYYHSEGILIPHEVNNAGYRYYDRNNLETLQQILFLRELDFPIKEIKKIMAHPDFNPKDALKKQRHLLALKRDRLDNLITLLDKKIRGEKEMSFKAFNMNEIKKAKEDYGNETKERWGESDAYTQSQRKTKNYTESDWETIHNEAEEIYDKFVKAMEQGPNSSEAQLQVKNWQAHISRNFYECTNEILAGLGLMYVGDERFTKNINAHKEGLAEFMSKAIEIFVK